MKNIKKIMSAFIGADRLYDIIRNNKWAKKYNIEVPRPSDDYENKKVAKSISKIFKKNDIRFNIPNGIENKGKILFLEPRGGVYIKVIMGMIAKRLSFHRYQVEFIHCDNLPVCNNRSILFPGNEATCQKCVSQSEQLFESFNLKSNSINRYIDNDIRIIAEKLTRDLNKKELEEFVYNGYPLGKFINISVCSYLYMGVPPDDQKSVNIIRSFLKGMIILYHAYEKILREYAPDKVIMTNGRFFWYKLAYEMCKRSGIPVVTMDDFGSTGGTGDRWMFSQDIPIAELELGTYWKTWEGTQLSKTECEYLEKNFIKYADNNKTYYSDPIREWDNIIKQLKIDITKPFDVMFTNLTWDSTAIDKDICFNSMFDWIFLTIDEYIKSKKQLLIRVHPAEKGIFGLPSFQKVGDEIVKKYKKLPDNIIIIPPESEISSYELLERAKLILVYSSTLGLEAALRGINVLVSGAVHYRDKGFTVDIKTIINYMSIINGEIQLPKLTVEQRDLAYRYAYFYLYRTKIPLEFYEAKRFYVSKIKTKKASEILPDHNPYLDLVIKGIMNNKPIILTREMTNNLYKL